jgi:transglutaminase-like putative cysteine protease
LRSFQISTNPRAQLYAYTDHLGNAVYHFNMLREHEELRIEAQAVVEIAPMRPLPEKLDPLEWSRYNSFNLTDDHFDMLGPSRFARRSIELESFMKIADLGKAGWRSADGAQDLQRGIYDSFDYEPGVTEVNSPIEVALEQRRGVCQDFAHIMTAIAREWGRALPLCFGLSLSQRQPRPFLRQRHPCLGGSLSAFFGLDRI